ncbi:MAG TPA: thioredoxin family protein [Candidatus Thermoplasmatota archaeon]|nr:thioredoxin family protein [Candidatus Thermoplasmatota archaeon]
MRPTEVPPPGLRDLRDADVPDFLEASPVALLAFLDGDDPACRRLRARLDALALRHPGVAFGALDVRSARLVAEALGVRSVPFACVFRGGEVVDRLIGSPPDAVLEDALRARGA